MAKDSIIRARDLAIGYGDHVLMERMDFGVAPGDVFLILGGSGTGKSTLLRLIAGTEPSDAGRRAVGRAAKIEYMSQRPELHDDLSALEQVLHQGPKAFEVVGRYEAACRALERDPTNEERLQKLEALSLEMDRVSGWTIEGEAKATLGFLGIKDATKKIGQMSGGQKKRVALARALIRPSDLLILDEPTQGLAESEIAGFNALIKDLAGSTTILLIEHNMDVVMALADVITVLETGQILASGTPDEIRQNRAVQDAYLGTS